MQSNESWEALAKIATALGASHGRNAAAWWEPHPEMKWDPAAVLKGIEDGDPQVLDTLPYLDLSGQWADGPNEQSILAEILDEEELEPEEADELVELYRDAYDEAVCVAVESFCRRMVKASSND
jgi:hypothetical protein